MKCDIWLGAWLTWLVCLLSLLFLLLVNLSMRDYKNDVQVLCKELKGNTNQTILKICEGEK